MMHMPKEKAALVPAAVRKIWAIIDGATNA